MAIIRKFEVPLRHQFLVSKLIFMGQAEQLLQRADAFYRASQMHLRAQPGADPHKVDGRSILEEAVFNATILSYGTPFKDPKFGRYGKGADIFHEGLLHVHENILMLRDKSVAHMESYTSKASVYVDIQEDNDQIDIHAQCIYFNPVYIFPNIAPNLKTCIDVAWKWFAEQQEKSRLDLRSAVGEKMHKDRVRLVQTQDRQAQVQDEYEMAIEQMALEYARALQPPAR